MITFFNFWVNYPTKYICTTMSNSFAWVVSLDNRLTNQNISVVNSHLN